MRSILVTGAAGAVGRRVVAMLTEAGSGDRVIALDRDSLDDLAFLPGSGSATLEPRQVDLLSADLDAVMADVDVVVHLAEDRSRKANARVARTILERLLSAAGTNGIKHFVLLSSGLVYGAHSDNPVPITESGRMRPSGLAHAELKADLEAQASAWAAAGGVRLTVLRPAVALSEGDSSWIGSAMRAALAIRPEQVDPPFQFVHHDDLARAVVHTVTHDLAGVYNVASDGWIGADAFRALRGETEVRLPERAGHIRHRGAKAFADRSLLEGLEPYVTHPWVMATDKLQATGWQATYSNEEVYVLGTSAPLLNSLGPQKRQELALGVAGAAGAAVIGAALWAARRLTR